MEVTQSKFSLFMAYVATAMVILLIVLYFGAFMRSIWLETVRRSEQRELDSQVSKTEPGRFAVENFNACKNGGVFGSSAPSDELCITETIQGAEKLQGAGFGSEVKKSLLTWRENSQQIRYR